MRFPRLPLGTAISRCVTLPATCLLALSGLGTAAPVPPTDNTAPPYLGLFAQGVYGNAPGGDGIGLAKADYAKEWSYRSTAFLETGAGYGNWAAIEGSGGALNAAQEWLRQNPDGTICLMQCMLPGSGPNPLPGLSMANGGSTDPAVNYDSHFVTLGNRLVSMGLADNIILRVGHEFNGNWYPWGVTQVNGSASDRTPAKFVAYYRRIVNAVRSVPGTENVKFSWCGMSAYYSPYPMSDAYPGDEYVDYIGADIYDASWNWYPYGGSYTNAQRQTYAWNALSGTSNNGLSAWRNFAASRGKPFVIPEWGLVREEDSDGHGGGDNTYFLQKMYDYIHEPSNNVYYHTYFDDVPAHRLVPYPATTPSHPNASALFHRLFSAPPLPLGADIGTTGAVGVSKALEVQGAGTGFPANATADSFRLSSRTAAGDETFSVKILTAPAGAGAQAGLMVRSTTADNAPYAAMFLNNGNLVFQSRTSAGAAALPQATVSGVTAPVWLKVLRRGNVFAGYRSSDGLNWTFVAGQTVAMSGSVHYGVAVSSGVSGTLATSTFDDIDRVDIDAPNEASLTGAVFVDNADATGVTTTGTWLTETISTDRYGANYLNDNNANKGSVSTRFTPTIPATGFYDVYLRWPAMFKRAYNVPVDVTSAGGVTALSANQILGRQQWNHLGTYTFNAGTTGNVLIGNTGTTKSVISDAVLFHRLPAGWAPSFTLFQNPLNRISSAGGYGPVTASIVGTDGAHAPYEGADQYKLVYTSGSVGYRMNFATQNLTGATHLRLARKGPLTNAGHSLYIRLVQSGTVQSGVHIVPRGTSYGVVDIPLSSFSGIDFSQVTGIFFYPYSATAGQPDTVYLDNLVFIKKF
jgi:hypothetical protein